VEPDALAPGARKHSGRAALRDRIKELGFELSTPKLARVFSRTFKSLADKSRSCSTATSGTGA